MKHQHILQQQLMEVNCFRVLYTVFTFPFHSAQQTDARLSTRAAAGRLYPADGGAAETPGGGRGEAGEAASRKQVQTGHPQAKRQDKRVRSGEP